MTQQTKAVRDGGMEAQAPDAVHRLSALPAREAVGVYRAIFERRDMRHFAGGEVDARTLARLCWQRIMPQAWDTCSPGDSFEFATGRSGNICTDWWSKSVCALRRHWASARRISSASRCKC